MSSSPAHSSTSAFATFWLFKANPTRFNLSASDRTKAIQSVVDVFDQRASAVQLRASYSTVGLSAGADLIFWLVANDPEAFQELGSALHH